MRFWRAGLAGLTALAALTLALPGDARAVKGKEPPDFTGTTLDGRTVTLSEFRGKNPVVLNFYADFCGPCRREFPHLKQMDEKLGPKGLRVVAVSLDEDRETAAGIPNQNRVRFPVVFDPKGSIAQKYAVQAIPHTVVIDRAGKVHQVITGLDVEGLERAVEQVMR